MNAMPKLVASRSLRQATQWHNSAVLQDDLVAAVRERKRAHDIMVTGSDQHRPHADGPQPGR